MNRRGAKFSLLNMSATAAPAPAAPTAAFAAAATVVWRFLRRAAAVALDFCPPLVAISQNGFPTHIRLADRRPSRGPAVCKLAVA